MARPERNTVDYFPHKIGDGKKMFFIEQKYGNDGYATWYKILEKLGATDYHYLNLNQEEEVMYLAAKCRVSEDKLLSIINDLSKLGAIDKELWENKIIWSSVFTESIQDAYNKRNNNCMSLDGLRELLLGLGILNRGLLIKKSDNNPQSKVNKSKEDKIEVEYYRVIAHLKLTKSEFDTLLSIGYSQSDIDGILDNIQNYKKNTQYNSLFLTAKNWLKKEHGIPEKNNTLNNVVPLPPKELYQKPKMVI